MNVSNLEELLSEIRAATTDTARRSAAKSIRELVESELKDVALGKNQINAASTTTESVAQSAEIMIVLNGKLQTLLGSSNIQDRLAGIIALDELIELDPESYRSKVQRSYNGLRVVLSKVWDIETSRKAAFTLGHLSRLGGILISRCVEAELAQSLERLRDTEGSTTISSATRASAVMVLHELADSVPALVYARRDELVGTIWNAACDVSEEVRAEAIVALGAFLTVVAQRETSEANLVLDALTTQIFIWLNDESSSTNQIHGSLLALGELLKSKMSADFLATKFHEICNFTLGYRSHKDSIVKRAVAMVIPLLANFDPRSYSDPKESRLDISFKFLLQAARNGLEEQAFVSIGKTALAIGGQAFYPYLNETMDLILDVLSLPKKSRLRPLLLPVCLDCIGLVATAVGSSHKSFTHRIFSILDPIIASGLSPELTNALNAISTSIPVLKNPIQERLLESALGILSSPARASTMNDPNGQTTALPATAILRALSAVGSFDFIGMDPATICTFINECLVQFMDQANFYFRKEATKACSRLLAAAAMVPTHNGRLRPDVAVIMSQLLGIAVADTHYEIRNITLDGLDDERFDGYLSQPESLRKLFLCLHDEHLSVKIKAVKLTGRLSSRNPANSLPALRKFLIQLLTALRCEGDSLRRVRNHAANLLNLLIRDAPRLVKPYPRPILTALITRLRSARAAGDTEAATPVLNAISDLASVGYSDLKPHLFDLLPLLVSCLVVQSAENDFKKSSLRALSRLIQNTGYVIEPYKRFPTLLPSLLNVIKNEVESSVRLEADILLGTLGAVDPGNFKYASLSTHGHGTNTASILTTSGTAYPTGSTYIGGQVGDSSLWSLTGNTLTETVAQENPEIQNALSSTTSQSDYKASEHQSPSWAEDDLRTESLVAKLDHPFTANQEYFPSASLDALNRILSDKRLGHYHREAVGAVVSIIQSLGPKCVLFLSSVLPRMFWLLRPGEEQGLRDFVFKEYVFKRLGEIIAVARQNMRPFVNDLIYLLKPYWTSNSSMLKAILVIVEKLCHALGDEFRPLIPELLPRMLGVLHTDRSDLREPTVKVLKAFETFGSHLDDYVTITLPVVLGVATNNSVPINVRKESLFSLKFLVNILSVDDLGSCLILPLTSLITQTTDYYPALVCPAILTLSAICSRNWKDFSLFGPALLKALVASRVRDQTLERLLADAGYTLPIELYRSTTYASSMAERPFKDKEQPSSNKGGPLGAGSRRIHVNQRSLRRAWEIGRRTTREDWEGWLVSLGSALFRESGSPMLRSCARLAEVYNPLARELFNAAFLSCWTELDSSVQASLISVLEKSLSAESLPLDVLQTLLSLAEFMEHDEKPLPIDIRRLAAMACRCGAFAKALHYKEAEYLQEPAEAISGQDGLISIYDSLNQRDSALGTLVDVEQRHGIRRREDWFEKLQKWDDALLAYESSNLEAKDYSPFAPLSELEKVHGRIRCLNELGEWRQMDSLCQKVWTEAAGNDKEKTKLAVEGGASVAFNLGRWEEFSERVAYVPEDTFEGSFYRALLAIHAGSYGKAEELVRSARLVLDTSLTARVAEGYPRAYPEVLNAQLLVELEDVVAIMKSSSAYMRNRLITTWKKRLNGCKQDHYTWFRALMVRSLVLDPHEDSDEWLTFSELCRKAGRAPMSSEALRVLLQPSAIQSAISILSRDNLSSLDIERLEYWDPNVALEGCDFRVTYCYLKYLWETGRRRDAYEVLRVKALSITPQNRSEAHLVAQALLKLSKWARFLREDALVGSGSFVGDDITSSTVLDFSTLASKVDPTWHKAWHTWALVNSEAASAAETETVNASGMKRYVSPQAKSFVVSAITGFFNSIRFGGKSCRTRLQDTLRLLTLWFRHGGLGDVQAALRSGFEITDPDLWLDVVPQMIARLHIPVKEIRVALKSLLIKIGNVHPQALVYPLTVAAKSTNPMRQEAANEILNAMRVHCHGLVEQAQLVSQELIRVAILWHEMWHEGLEEASRMYFGERSVEGMFNVLAPLHAMMEAGPQTAREAAFHREFGRDLSEAAEWCRRFQSSRRENDINQAWDLYYHVFRRINKQLPQMTTLELSQVSPKLIEAKNLELAVPGTYQTAVDFMRNLTLITIEGFASTLTVISSKQRPRKLVINGSDGMEHTFLLKGHEDLRQDERVMQLFGLVNELLAQSKETSSRDLAIKRFSVVPLSPNSGLIGWVPECDTLHSLVRDFREQRKILLNVEHRLMLQMAPDYDHISILQKVEVFEYALANTTGADIARVLWLKSRNAEMWLDRRTNYARSLATMSIIGYILGLGDRHPSNLMLERSTGKILHIDFGDCFEVAMHREKYPEKVPFRLTRMLVNALEVCGIEGSFRHTCEAVMTVIRSDKASLMAMLEAFVHDPLINWRLLAAKVDGTEKRNNDVTTEAALLNQASVGRAALDALRQASLVHDGINVGSLSKSASRTLLEAGVASLTDIADQELKAELDAVSRRRRPKKATDTVGQEIDIVNSVHESTLKQSAAASSTLRRGLQKQVDPEGVVEFTDAVNQRAVAAIQRVSNKLTGRDFDLNEMLHVPAQVDRLIKQATNIENLCQAYIGWCAFW